MAECRFLLEKTQEPSDLLEDSPSGNPFLGEENGRNPDTRHVNSLKPVKSSPVP